MRKILISFSGSAYDATTKLIVENGPKLGADAVYIYDDAWLREQEYYAVNRWLFEVPNVRGVSWFSWKPFIILDALDRLSDGDVLLYTDGDTHPVGDFSALYSQCAKDGGAMFFNAYGCDNRQYTKRDCYVVMGQDHPPYTDHRTAGVARFMLFQRGPWKPRQFLMEWLTYCVNPKATTFDASTIAPEYEGYGEHRTEQAIMTLLTYKYGYKLYREACQFGAGQPEDQDLYPQLFEQVWGAGPRNMEGSRYRNV